MLELPVDLLVELSSWLPASDLCNLRLVCKSLGDLLAPQAFRNIVIDLKEHRLERDLRKLQALANGYPLAVQGARHLRVGWLRSKLPPPITHSYSAVPRPESLMPQEEVQEMLDATLVKALSCLDGLKSIRLHSVLGDENAHLGLDLFYLAMGFSGLRDISFCLTPAILSQPFPSCLPSLHSLDVFFGIFSKSDATKAVTELSRLVGSSASLSYLKLDRPAYDKKWHFPSPYGGNFLPHADSEASSSTLPIRHLHINNIPFPMTGFMHHFRRLTSLSVEYQPWSTFPWDRTDAEDPEDPRLSDKTCRQDLWQNLLRAEVRLESIDVDYVCDDFLCYMASYSGLRNLSLRTGEPSNAAQESKTAAQFYQITLPRHADSLVTLRIYPAYEGDWSFSSRNWDTIKRCANLTELSLDIHCGRDEADSLTDLKEVITSVSQCLPKVVQLSLKDGYPAWMRDIICAYGYDSHANSRRLHAEACTYRTSQSGIKLPKLTISSMYRYEPATGLGEDGQRVHWYEVVEKPQSSFSPWGRDSGDDSD